MLCGFGDMVVLLFDAPERQDLFIDCRFDCSLVVCRFGAVHCGLYGDAAQVFSEVSVEVLCAVALPRCFRRSVHAIEYK